MEKYSICDKVLIKSTGIIGVVVDIEDDNIIVEDNVYNSKENIYPLYYCKPIDLEMEKGAVTRNSSK